MTSPFSPLQGSGIALGYFPCPYQVPRGHTAMPPPLPSGLNLSQEALPPCPPFAYYGFLLALLKRTQDLLSSFLTYLRNIS